MGQQGGLFRPAPRVVTRHGETGAGCPADFGGGSERVVIRFLLEVLCALPADLPVHEAGVLDGDACVQRGLRCRLARPARGIRSRVRSGVLAAHADSGAPRDAAALHG